MKIFPPEYSAVCEAFIELHRNNHTIHLLYDSFIVHNALGLEGQVMAERISWGAHKPTEGTYTGQWSETHHRPHGFGTLIYNERDPKHKTEGWISYTGQWHNGSPHGVGTVYYKSGARYDGHWLNGRRHGEAVMSYRVKRNTRVRFIGIYESDQKQHGILSTTTGKGLAVSYTGKFRGGHFDDDRAWCVIGPYQAHRKYKQHVWIDKPVGTKDSLPDILQCRK